MGIYSFLLVGKLQNYMVKGIDIGKGEELRLMMQSIQVNEGRFEHTG